jgi:hypothetical protein
LAHRQSPTRTVARSTSALAEFHALAGHAGPAEGCQDCAAQLTRQRQAASALRTHQRQARQRVDAVIDEDPGDEQAELRRDAERDDLGPDDEPLWERWERWGW